MIMAPIVRTVCMFAKTPDRQGFKRLEEVCKHLQAAGMDIQTKRLLAASKFELLDHREYDDETYLSMGSMDLETYSQHRALFRRHARLSCTIDITRDPPTARHVAELYDLMTGSPEKTFYFSYSVNQPDSSPFFPSARYSRDGFSIGLQTTDLAARCATLAEWCDRMQAAWQYVAKVAKPLDGFLGIDSSVAPLGAGEGSLVRFVREIHGSFGRSMLTDFYLQLTGFIKSENMTPCGLNGLMLPCLEDFLLAEEYEAGNFNITHNLFLSLNCGLGVDTYPIGMNEDPAAVLDVLRLVRGLSLKYRKPLAVRFVSDGRGSIGDRSSFNNQFLRDVNIRALVHD